MGSNKLRATQHAPARIQCVALGQARTRLSTHGSGTVYGVCVGVNDWSTAKSGYSDQCREGRLPLHSSRSELVLIPFADEQLTKLCYAVQRAAPTEPRVITVGTDWWVEDLA